MPIFRYLRCTALALIALAPFAACADDTTIDTSFNPNGADPGWRRAYDNIQPTSDQLIVGAARAPDGGYVLAGTRAGGSGGALIFLAKFRPNGAYDSSFGGTAQTGNAGSGRVLKDANLASVKAMTIDAQGRIVVVGETQGVLGQADFGAVRFNSNGSDDTSFAGDGSTQIGFDLDSVHGHAKDTPTSVTTAPDGSVYVAGVVDDVSSGGFPTTRLGVAKLMPDGSNTNTHYGTLPYGRQLFYCNDGCENVDQVKRIVYDAPRNRIVIGGDYYLNENDADWFITTQYFAPYPSSKTCHYPIDFGGISGNQVGLMTSLAVQPDGKTVALGIALDPNQKKVPVVLRVQSDIVNEDSGFGNVSGRGLMLIETVDAIYSDLAIDSSGRIVLAGYYLEYDAGLVTRLLPGNGAVDTGFNGDTAPTAFFASTSNGNDTADATSFGRVFIDGGRPVLAGQAPDSSTGAYSDFDLIITRLQADRIFVNGVE